MNDLTIAVILKLRDELSNGLTGAAGKLEAFGQKARAIGGALEGIGYRVGGIGLSMNHNLAKANLSVGDVVNSAIDAQGQLLQMANTAGIAGNAAVVMADKYKGRLNEIARTTNQTLGDLLVAQQDLVSRGLDPDKALAALPAIGKTATATASSISDIAKSSYAAIDNLKIPVDRLAQSLGMMAQAGNAGAFELRDMSQYFPMLTAQAGTLGMVGQGALGQLAAAAQIARKGTGDAASAATNLQNFLLKLNAPDAVKNFQKYGVNLADEVKNGLASGDLIGYMAELILKTTGGDAGKIATLFQDAQVRQFLSPMLANIEEYKRIRDTTLAAGAGVVDTQFDTILQGTGAKLKAVEIGAQTAISNSSALDSVLDKLNAVAGWANEHPELAGWLAMTAVGAAAGGLAIGGAALAIGGIVSAVGNLATVLSGMATFLAANPVVAALLGIGAAAVAGWAFGSWLSGQIDEAVRAVTGDKFATLGTKIYDIAQWFKGLPARIKAALAGLVADMKSVGAQIINGLIQGMKERAQAFTESVKGVGADAYKGIKDFFGIKSPSTLMAEVGRNIGAGMALGIDASAPLVQAAADKLAEVVIVDPVNQPRFATGKFKSGMDAAVQGTGLMGGANEYLGSIKAVADGVKDTVARAFKGMEDALVGFVKNGKLDFRSLADSIISDIARIAIQQSITQPLANMFGSLFGFANGGAPGGPGSNLGAWRNQVVDRPTLFAFASGGVMGEAGPEAIMPLRRGAGGRLGVDAAGMGNVTVNVINNASGTQATAQERTDGNGNRFIDVVVEQIKGAIAGDIARGSGAIPGALASTYGLNRVAGAY